MSVAQRAAPSSPRAGQEAGGPRSTTSDEFGPDAVILDDPLEDVDTLCGDDLGEGSE